jgi:hypothetical protein
VVKIEISIQLIASFVVAFVFTSLQAPSSAQLPTSLSMGTGMSNAEIQKMYDGLDKAITQVGAVMSKASNAGKTKITDTTLARSGTLAVDDRYTCMSGGYIASTMATTTVLTKTTGFLTISAPVRQNIFKWKCVTGWVVNGSLNLNYKIFGPSTGETSSASGGVSGAWKSVGPKNIKQSCQLKGSVQK